MPKTVIIYHKDLDGYAAASLLYRWLPESILIPMEHGEEFPWEKIENEDLGLVFLLDFVLYSPTEKAPMEQMWKLGSMCKELVWIDHHLSAYNKYAEASKIRGSDIKNCRYVYDVNFSGCELTWTEMIKDIDMPEYISLIGSADIWRDHGTYKWSYEIEPFVTALGMLQTDPAESMTIWDSLHEGAELDEFIRDGRCIMRYNKKKFAERALRNGHEIEFEGYRCIATNSDVHNSAILDAVYDDSKHDFRVVYHLEKGSEWIVNLYNSKGIDGSSIAMKYGGGGHAPACSFSCKELPW
jgi:oligoribonuclease NrnB/cAMP/cGMP phosphodiesterase (DHH superfamily)